MSKKVKHEYSDDELIRRVTDIEEVKKLANKRVFYQINGWREKELDEYERLLFGEDDADTVEPEEAAAEDETEAE